MTLMRINGVCRECGRQITTVAPSKPKQTDAEYVRCRECDTVTRLTVADKDSKGAWRDN